MQKKRARHQMNAREKEVLKSVLLQEMTRHVGASRAIGMGELYVRVFQRAWENRINDTRRLRLLVTELRRRGVPICSTAGRTGGGYYLAAAASDLDAYCQRLRTRALKLLAQESRLRQMTMPDLLGQIQLKMRPPK